MNVKFQGRISAIIERLVTMPDGKCRVFEYAERPPGVRLLVVAGDNVLVTREWRHELNGFDVRIPGGKVFDTFAEYRELIDRPDLIASAAHEAARRELAEETGIIAQSESISHLKTTECGATIGWRLHYFVVKARQEVLAQRINTAEGELIEPHWVSPATLMHFCLNGEMREDRTVAVLVQWIVKFYPHIIREEALL